MVGITGYDTYGIGRESFPSTIQEKILLPGAQSFWSTFSDQLLDLRKPMLVEFGYLNLVTGWAAISTFSGPYEVVALGSGSTPVPTAGAAAIPNGNTPNAANRPSTPTQPPATPIATPAPAPTPQATRIKISPSANGTATVMVGRTLQFNANVLDATGAILSQYPVSWSAPVVGTVSSNGLFAAPATTKPGTTGTIAEVYAHAAGLDESVLVYVLAPTVQVASPSSVFRPGVPVQFTASLTFNGQPVTDVPIVWRVDGVPGVVSSTGLLTIASSASDYSTGYVCAFAGVAPTAARCDTAIGNGIGAFQFSVFNR